MLSGRASPLTTKAIKHDVTTKPYNKEYVQEPTHKKPFRPGGW
jgi:hypothetical protein